MTRKHDQLPPTYLGKPVTADFSQGFRDAQAGKEPVRQGNYEYMRGFNEGQFE